MTVPPRSIEVVDPQGSDALTLLREAAIEARSLYPELYQGEMRWPSNPPTPAGGIYLVAYEERVPLACGALRPIDGTIAEVRRMYVLKTARRSGLARLILVALEQAAVEIGYNTMRLETGNRQSPAMALYESCGFTRIAPFGEYMSDPTSVCYEKHCLRRAA